MEKQLTAKLFIPILTLSLITFGFSFMRQIFAKNAGANAYLTILMGFLIAAAGLFLMKSLAFKYPDQSVIYLGDKLLGPLGKIGNAALWIAVFLFAAILIRRITDEVSAIILFRTPGLVSILAYFLVIGYMAFLGEEALGRLASVFLLGIPVFSFILFLSFLQVKLLNIHPVNIIRDPDYLWKWDLWSIVFAPVWILCAFYGNDSLRKSFRTVILFVAGGTLILAAACLAAAGSFGPRGLSRYEWPVMSLVNITEFAASYLFQNFMTAGYFFIFLFFSLITAAAFLIILSKGAAELSGLKSRQWKTALPIVAAGLFALTMLPTLINYKEITPIILKAGSLYIPAYILLIWLSSLFRRKDRK
ncbi:MAG: GerAB/ArcD/ProY family transporter [Bacillota bacterium]